LPRAERAIRRRIILAEDKMRSWPRPHHPGPPLIFPRGGLVLTSGARTIGDSERSELQRYEVNAGYSFALTGELSRGWRSPA
jgi:hypothetical protein